MILCLIINIYWKFNFDELDEKIKSSFSIPIFAICYTPSCQECSNIKSQYNDLISISGNRTDMYTSMINCLAHEDFCQYLGILKTPTSLLLIGNNSRYWPKTYSNKAEEWISFIDKYVNSNLKKIDLDNKKKLENIIEKTTENGGVTYYIVIKDTSDTLLRKIRRIAYHYLIYNVSFVYSIDENCEKASITRFYTKNYSTQFKGDINNVDDFIYEIQFGPLHKYDYKEWKKVKSPKMFLFTNQDFLLSSQKNGLIKLTDKFHQISFGWASTEEEKSKQFYKDFPLNDLPVNIIYDMNYINNSCFAITKERTMDISDTDFLNSFLNKKLICNQTLDSSNVTKIIPIKSKKISGKRFLVLYIVIVLVIIGFLRLKPTDEEKGE